MLMITVVIPCFLANQIIYNQSRNYLCSIYETMTKYLNP